MFSAVSRSGIELLSLRNFLQIVDVHVLAYLGAVRGDSISVERVLGVAKDFIQHGSLYNFTVVADWQQGWAKFDSKLQALCPDLDHQAFQAFWGNSRKLIEKGKTNILSRLKLYTYGDHVCTLIKIRFLVS